MVLLLLVRHGQSYRYNAQRYAELRQQLMHGRSRFQIPTPTRRHDKVSRLPPWAPEQIIKPPGQVKKSKQPDHPDHSDHSD